jgi:hypothetical protein
VAAAVIKLARLPDLSPTARRLLIGHRPGVPAYRAWALGRVRAAADLAPIDAAYAELVAHGLMAADGGPLPVLPGESRRPFVLTAEGDRVRRLARR